MRKWSILGAAILISMLVTGCSSSGTTVMNNAYMPENGAGITMDSVAGSQMNSAERSYDYSDVVPEDIVDTEEVESTGVVDTSDDDMKQMLVYSGNLNLTTKDYQTSYNELQNILTETGSFIEWSEYSVKQNNWSDESGLRCWNARVRVPADNYDKLTDGAMTTAEVERFNSNVQNLTAEYSDLMSSIDLYRASRKRYLNLLETITDDEYALSVERELRDIEEQLARYEARKKVIETDVAYSYLNIELREVHAYEAQTDYRDSFGTRLKNQVVNTFLTFLQFLEAVLFFLIAAFPYLIILGVVIFVCIKLVRKSRKPFRGDNFSSDITSPQSGKTHDEKSADMNSMSEKD